MIYLDNGATSFPKPQVVLDAVKLALESPASPGRSGHKPALEASRTIYRARKNIATLFGITKVERVIFTPNITWALNIALWGLSLNNGDHVLSSALEHNSVGRPLNLLVQEKGIVWETVEPSSNGLLRAEDFKEKLRPNTKLVVLAHASNVTGAIAPVKEIKEVLGENIPLLLDSAQTAGSLPMEDISSYVDILTFTGHKGLLGPTGTGGLWIKEGVPYKPLAVGGTGSKSESLIQPDFLPDALEAGTLNTHGLSGLAAAVKFLLDTGVDKIRDHEMELAFAFIDKIVKIKGLTIIGPGLGIKERVATISIVLDNWSSSDLSKKLEEDYGIMIRAGLHCAPLAHNTTGSFPGGASRFSFGFFNTLKEAHIAANALETLANMKPSILKASN
jgi:cysteine desulfurase family protein